MRAAAGLPLLGGTAALLALSVFLSAGTSEGRLFWIGAAALLLASAALVAGELGALPRPRLSPLGARAFLLLSLFVAWGGVSIGWSIAPDRSWGAFNRGLVYLAFALLGLVAAALLARAATATAAALALLLSAALAWALLGKVFPGLFPDGARVARLRSPVGYWNALALLCALALPLGLWLAAHGRRRPARLAGALLIYTACVALVLTLSRAGLLVAAAGVALWLALSPRRLQGLAALLAAAAPAAAVSAWALTRPGLVEDLQPRSLRAADGAWLALALALGAAAVLLLAQAGDRWGGRLDPRARRAWARRLGVAAAVTALVAASAYAALSGGPGRWLDEFRGSSQVTQGSGRLGALSSNNRWAWWQEAWRLFLARPAAGSGAGSFEVARRPIRRGDIVTNEPHNLALQALAETGLIGFLLGAGAALVALAAVRQALRQLPGRERPAATALAPALPLYLLHALADIDWEFVAVSGPVFFVAGLLLAAGGRRAPPRRRPARALAVASLGLALVYSLAAPWLAARRVEEAYAAIGRADPQAAQAAARQARWLNPLSTEPLAVWALADAAAGDVAGALRRYRAAAELQPRNGDTWYDLGAFELAVGRYRDAYRHLDRAYGLDPYGPAGRPGGLLDRARARVEGR
jgi:tetratricopeptide (TPR) repeat protein